MYFNNIQIMNYVVIGIIGLIIGKFTAWCNIRIPEKQKIFSKEFFKVNKEGIPGNYIFMIITALLYVALLFKFGIDKVHVMKNLDLLKFLIFLNKERPHLTPVTIEGKASSRSTMSDASFATDVPEPIAIPTSA